MRASRDGDQFHYLWAARECLALISPTAELVAVTVEGAATSETQAGLEAGDEVIDIAKYYGDLDLGRAHKVVYSQLKHSTLRKDQAWTFSGVKRTITGFAKKYREIAAQPHGPTIALKLNFSFVSNRAVQSALKLAFAQIANGTTVEDEALRLEIEQATGLDGNSLQNFCRQFAFDVGHPDYWDQRHLLRQELRGYLPGPDVDAPLQLKELVTRKALSEFGANNVITRIDVLRALRSDVDEMFPAPCRIERPDHVIPRAQTGELVNDIVAAAGVPFIVHAESGVGKSIFTLSIQDALPPGSVAILYDCFGNGAYRSVSGYRHRHRDAAVQIANELASLGLCHPLLQSPHAEGSDYVKALLHRLGQASGGLRAQSPEAVLTVIIDAADNAQMAAEEFGEARSFVVDLIRAHIPEGVRIVFLCRTHRQYLLKAPPEAVARELKPFSLDETRVYLLESFADATEREISEFHRLSSHNPRVQALALAQGGALREIITSLGPNPTTVESALADLLAMSLARVRDEAGVAKGQIDKICAGLATLRPLVPISVLSALSGAPEAAIRSFALDLGRPLFVSGDLIHFLDEPSETWFRETFKPKPSAMTKFVAHLKPLADQSSYVAAVLPQLMLEAGQLKQLVTLALSSDSLPGDNPIERRDVALRRLQFALKASLRAQRWSDAAKLSLKAGGETAGDDRQNDLIASNTDLAARFLSTDRVQELVSRRVFKTSWLGSHNCYEAGLMSYHPALRVEVRSRLRMAEEWLQNFFSTPEDLRSGERLEDADITEMAMAILNISNALTCVNFLSSWRPKEVAFRIGRLLASRLIDQGRLADLKSLADASSNVCLLLAINDELLAISESCSQEVLHKLLRILSLKKVKLEKQGFDREETALAIISNLVRACVRYKVGDKSLHLALLNRYLPDKPPLGLASRWGANRVPFLRGKCLQAALEGTPLAIADFADAKLKIALEQDHYQSSSDVREFNETVGRLLPWYTLQADADVGNLSEALLHERIAQAVAASQRTDRYYDNHDIATDDIAILWINILGSNNALTDQSLSAFEKWRQGLKRPLYPATLTRLAHYLARVNPDSPLILSYAATAFQATKNIREDAESKSRDFVGLARAVLTVSPAEAQVYFDQAVTVASRIGQENLDRWGALLDLADQAGKRSSPDPEMAYRLSRCAELTYEYVTRDKHFAWEDTIAAIVNLCPASSLAIFSRWRDRRFGNPHRILAQGIDTLIERKCLSPAIAIPLFTLPAHWQYVDLLPAAFEAIPAAQRQRAFDFYWHYLSLESWEARHLEKIRSAAGALSLRTDQIDERIRFEQNKKKSDQVTGRDSGYEPGDPPQRDWNAVFSGLNLVDTGDLMTAFARYKALDRAYHSPDFYGALFDRAPVAFESQVLRALAQFPEFSLYELRGVLEAIPPAWKSRVAIQAALADIVVATCRRYCLQITKSRYYQILPLQVASGFSALPEESLVLEVLKALADLPDQFDSGRLFTLNGLLAVLMKPKEAADALSFGLKLLEPALEDKDGDGPWTAALAPSNKVPASLAGYIWASLSSPRADTRWEATHAVHALCYFDVQDVLKPLVRFAQLGEGQQYADRRLHFYDLHGVQWLLIGLARSAISVPNSVVPFVAFLKAQAKRSDNHALMRGIAVDALLSLAKAGAITLSKAAIAELTATNVPKIKAVKRDRNALQPSPYDRGEDYTFGIDIGPYWFAPLGRVFGKSQGEIAHMATEVITKEWGLGKVDRWDEDERYRLKIFRDSETMHSHGSPPRTDDMRFYLGYHAMMAVAGSLLATVAPMEDREGLDESFADWMRGHSLTRPDGRWIFDRRDPLPLDWPTWKDEKDDEWWQWGVQRADFEKVLFPADGKVVLRGDWTYVAGQRSERIAVSCALTPPETSAALLRSLQTTSPREYYLPDVGDTSQITEEGFELTGLINDRTLSKELDSLDSWAGELKYPGLAPSKDVVDFLGLTADVESRIWTDSFAQPQIWSETWTYDSDEEREGDKAQEEGRRLTMSVDALCRYLGAANKNLTVSIKIERSNNHRYGASKDEFVEYPYPYARIFVISADAVVRSL